MPRAWQLWQRAWLQVPPELRVWLPVLPEWPGRTVLRGLPEPQAWELRGLQGVWAH